MSQLYRWPIDKIVAMYNAGATLDEIAIKLGTVPDHRGKPQATTGRAIGKALHRLGHKLRSTGAKGERNRAWNGGRRIDKDGYVCVYKPEHPDARKSGYVLEHRLVAEEALGRRLTRKEIVHHKDDNKQNNHPANLVLYPHNGAHLSETRRGIPPNWSTAGKATICAALVKGRAKQQRNKAAGKKPRPKQMKTYETLGIALG